MLIPLKEIKMKLPSTSSPDTLSLIFLKCDHICIHTCMFACGVPFICSLRYMLRSIEPSVAYYIFVIVFKNSADFNQNIIQVRGQCAPQTFAPLPSDTQEVASINELIYPHLLTWFLQSLQHLMNII